MAARKLSEGSTGSEGRVVGPDIESNGATHSMSIAVCLGSLGSYWASVFQEKALGPNRLWSPRNEMFEKHEEAQICAHCQDPPTTSNPLAHLEATRRYCKNRLAGSPSKATWYIGAYCMCATQSRWMLGHEQVV